MTGSDLTALYCTSGGSGAVGTRTASVTLAAGASVTCTFTNTKRATLIVEKQTNPDAASGSFSFTGTATGSIGDGGQIVVNNLVPGNYTSTEADPTPNFDLTSIVCNDGNSSGDVSSAWRRLDSRQGRRSPACSPTGSVGWRRSSRPSTAMR